MISRRTFIISSIPTATMCKADIPTDPITDQQVFAVTHMRLLYNFRYEDALITCGKKRCNRPVDDIRKTMSGNCRDYVLIDTLLLLNIREISALWCRRYGEPHLVVLHRPSDTIADNWNLNAMHVDKRQDLSNFIILWEDPQEWKNNPKIW